MNILCFLSIFLFSFNSLAEFTITAPASVDVQYNVEEVVSVTISSDIADTMRRIRLIGLTSTDSQSCVKSFTAGENCTFSVAKTITRRSVARIYLYPLNSSREIQNIVFDIAETSTRDDLTSGIEIFNNNQSITSLPLGPITLDSIAGTRVYVRNTGSQRTSAIEAMSSTYTGSTAFTLARDTCAGRALDPGRTCYFDVRLLPQNAIAGSNTGNYIIRASGETVGTDLPISADLTIPNNSGGGNTGGNEGQANVDYFCTQTGLDESGFSSPPFCTAAGEAVNPQYLASCFINPTWCELNTQSQNSVVASTNGNILGFRYHSFRGATIQGQTMTSEVKVTFIEKTRAGDNNPLTTQDLSPLFTTNVYDQSDFGYRPPSNTLNVSGPYHRQSFRVNFIKKTVSNSQLIAALDADSTDTFTPGEKKFPLVEGDLLMTDAQLYSKYENNILSCFAAGGDILRLVKIQTRISGDLGSGIPHGPPTTTVFEGICGDDPEINVPGPIEPNYETHGFIINAVSNDFSSQTTFGILEGDFTYLEDFYPHVFSIPLILDYGTNSFEGVELKYIETEAAIE